MKIIIAIYYWRITKFFSVAFTINKLKVAKVKKISRCNLTIEISEPTMQDKFSIVQGTPHTQTTNWINTYYENIIL